MNPRVITVEATNNHFLKLSFDNDEIKLFDASPFLDKGIFKELQDYNYFKQVSVAFGSVEWPNEQDFSYDTLYLLSKTLA
ncbi:hypothetical protein CMT41_08620 [Colwellia sp. MT41]|uniref:DUF2442 domain-containing protein n=1 Tax=Colwellia marinimaniae TaxID=1513592 RepID=A0ABQ0MZH7_9GAMM|nr:MULTISPECIES: DUF2442 domain-containing protein [Colwellia]ALO34770.1 hypothetical protein CMT41_08620 [Colwellia sp. MT41]GAW97774.1 hypothetical protein MTCD1_03417 [Colwellia marinimaniae]